MLLTFFSTDNREVAEKLIECGVDADEQYGDDLDTPMHTMAQMGHKSYDNVDIFTLWSETKKVRDLLLKHKTNLLNIKNKRNHTPYEIASMTPMYMAAFDDGVDLSDNPAFMNDFMYKSKPGKFTDLFNNSKSQSPKTKMVINCIQS